MDEPALIRALFNLASPSPGEAALTAISGPRGDLSTWTDFLRLAEAARLLPLIAWRLREQPGLPSEDRKQLDDLFHGNNLRNLVRVRELIRVSRKLEERQIRALALKGPAVATLCYRNLGSRAFDDLDVLIHPRDVPATLELLLEDGYDHWLPGWNREQLKRFFARSDYLRFLWWDQAMLTRRDPRVTLEIHWAALPRYFAFELPFDELWEQRQTVSLSGHDSATLSPPDMLLLIAAHGAKHQWSSPKWLCDLSWAIHRYSDLDWRDLENRARQRGGLRILRVACLLANKLFTAPLSLPWLKHLRRDESARRLAREIEDSLLESIARNRVFPEPLSRGLRLRERPLDRVRTLGRSLLTPSSRDCRWISLPVSLFPLYRLIRPLRLAVDGLRRWT